MHKRSAQNCIYFFKFCICFILQMRFLQSRKFCVQKLKYPQGNFEYVEHLSPM